jgi:hypothetical protein
MARKSVGRVSCPNDTCALHDRRDRSNVVLHGYSKTRWGHRDQEEEIGGVDR